MAFQLSKMCSERDNLVTQYRGYVQAVAKGMIVSLGLPAEHLDEILAAGYLGLVEAASRFDPKAKTDFKLFAYRRIRGAIIDSIRRNSEISGKAYKLSKAWSAIDLLEDAYIQDPDSEQDPQQTLAKVLEFAASGAIAFRCSFHDLEQEASEVCTDNNQEKILLEKEAKNSFKSLIDRLPEKERFIIEAYYFEEKSFAQITLEMGEHTKSWVSRLHAQALSRLKYFIIESRRSDDA
jgi:RNA polymerase sigma factor for flagellar operon FliA